METKKRGKIILFAGTDRSGKETQTNLLVDRLVKEGIPTAQMSFPRYDTPTGRIIGQCYLGKEGPKQGVYWEGERAWFGDAQSVDPRIATLYYAADRFMALPEIEDIISSGKNLVLNRYVSANMGHQGGKAKTPEEREKRVDFINDLEYGLLELPKPDLTIFLYMPYEVGIKLGEKMKEKPDGHEANPEHLRSAEKCYLYLAERFGWKKIDCAPLGFPPRTPEDIHKEVYKYVKENL